ncbi:MAG TPA: TIGR03560 family F420-dependent LLM class oxidoreductase [Streptosporangiaceae bacterium]|jgi:F420-dependent oxidoreductase-like protein|nr:TIGR03560 family F420-dependent LLM class oxidoreductase [Streptosporangiaceae bacterium]
MRFSIWPTPAQSWDDIHELTAHCEQTGWDGVYFADHFMPNGPEPLDGDVLECWSIIAALAASVPRLRLAPLVTSVTYRHPTVLAKIAAAVDQVSGGRLTLGVGAGWQVNEHAAYGLALGTVRERMDRFEEAVQILRSLLTEPRTTFAGEYFQVADAPAQPAPVQERMPLLIGGGGERRTLRIAARYADHWNAWSTPEVLAHKISVLREHCEQVGRDPAEIHVSTQALLYLSTDEAWVKKHKDQTAGPPVIAGTPGEVTDIVARYQEAGADELIVPDFTFGSMDHKKETCDLFMKEVAPAFR